MLTGLDMEDVQRGHLRQAAGQACRATMGAPVGSEVHGWAVRGGQLVDRAKMFLQRQS
jgi:hypothetical protein